MAKAIVCPACSKKFELESDLDIGDIVICSRCDASLKIVSLTPFEVKIFSTGLDKETLLSENKKERIKDGRAKKE